MTIGHEYVGTVAEMGAGVTDFKIGERVTGEGHIACIDTVGFQIVDNHGLRGLGPQRGQITFAHARRRRDQRLTRFYLDG